MIGYKIEQQTDGTYIVILVSLGNHEELLRSVDDGYTRHENAQALVEILRKAGLDLVGVDEDPVLAPRTEYDHG